MKTPENVEKDKVRAWLKAEGIYFFCPVQMGLGERTVDILVALPIPELPAAIFLSIEVKRRGKKPTPLQNSIMRRIRGSNGVAIWGDDGDKIIEQIQRIRHELVFRLQTQYPLI